MRSLPDLLHASAALHRQHLCPRQVLGVRMGLWAGEMLNLDVPQTGQHLLTIMETDGCGADGVSVATNCWIGRRTMQIVDYGKVAATFVERATERAIRIAPHSDIRQRAIACAPEASNTWQAQLLGYQRLPAADMFVVQPVALSTPLALFLSRPGQKAICDTCGEEIINEREIQRAGLTLCRACAGPAYYHLLDAVAFQKTPAVCQPASPMGVTEGNLA